MPKVKVAHKTASPLEWKGRIRRGMIPPTRDPFINSLMTTLTPDKNGAERFFIATYNSISGCQAACINEYGENRIYHFNKPLFAGFYSVTQENDDTLWLCGTLDKVVRLTLSTGKVEVYETGAPHTLIFQAMILDKPTGKLFAVAFNPPKTVGFSFDYRSRKPVRLMELPQEAGKYGRFSVPNGDGTWSMIMHMPGNHLFIWDPRTDQVNSVTITPTYQSEDLTSTSCMVIRDDAGRFYFPLSGWYDPATRTLTQDGPRPNREMTWFGRMGQVAIGVSVVGSTATVGRWDMASGRVTPIATISDCSVQSLNLTASGKVVGVNLYGEFFRLDAVTGAIESTRRLDVTGVGHVDTLCLIDDQRLLGTPFITQRFWELNLKTGKGGDCGRAAPGVGEIMKLCKVGSKVYMSAYTGGELVEYDPAQPSRFPENPRVVADPPVGMRPVAIDHDGRNVYYSCSRDYGKLGSILTRYDTRTGVAAYGPDPLGDQMIRSIVHDRASNSLVCGTTFHADCESCPPTSDECFIARLDAQAFNVLERCAAPRGATSATVHGPMGKDTWLCSCRGGSVGARWFVLAKGAFATPGEQDLHAWPTEQAPGVLYAGRPGRFLLSTGRLEVWDFRKNKLVRVLPTMGAHIHNLAVQDDSVLFVSADEAFVLYDALKGV